MRQCAARSSRSFAGTGLPLGGSPACSSRRYSPSTVLVLPTSTARSIVFPCACVADAASLYGYQSLVGAYQQKAMFIEAGGDADAGLRSMNFNATIGDPGG